MANLEHTKMTDNEAQSLYITTGKENTEEVIKFGLNPAYVLFRTEPIRIRDVQFHLLLKRCGMTMLMMWTV